MHRGDRSGLDHRCQRCAVGVVQARRLARRLAVDQIVGPGLIELHHSVADDLKRHAPDPGRLGPGCPVIDRRERQKTTRMRSMLAPPRRRTQRRSIKIGSKGKRHGEPPAVAR